MKRPFEKRALVIFVREPLPGKVKTRLAAGVGERLAAEIYKKLLRHTREVTERVDVKRQVWYAGGSPQSNLWPDSHFEKRQQGKGGLGEKLLVAFESGFQSGYTSVVAIGSDCFDITSAHIDEAFTKLQTCDLVLGPSSDGGYYLIGLSRPAPRLFSDMPWSTPELYSRTLSVAESMSLTLFELEELNDIDTVEDLEEAGYRLPKPL